MGEQARSLFVKMLANKITNVVQHKTGVLPCQLPQSIRSARLTARIAHRESLGFNRIIFIPLSLNPLACLYRHIFYYQFLSSFPASLPPIAVPGLSLGRKFSVRVNASDSQNAPSTPPQDSYEQYENAVNQPTEQTTQEAIASSTTAEASDADLAAALALPELSTAVAPAQPSGPLHTAHAYLAANPVAYWSLFGIGAFLVGTFLIAVGRTTAKGFSSQGKRNRTVNKNKLVVEELSKYLPVDRTGLTGGVVTGIRLRTGFSPVELFRKYLWYLLRERKFDQEAVEDLIVLKSALGLNDAQVAEALNERAKRVYDKYGNVMLDTTGMSPAGIERKATSRALFSKLQFLVQCEPLLAPEAAANVNLRDIFGATEDDAARLRIPSLYEVDLEAAMDLPSAEGGDANEEGEEESTQQQ